MKRKLLLPGPIPRMALLMILMVWISAPVLKAQFSPKIEKGLDDYYSELVKVYQIIESNEVSVALKKIDDLKPSIEQKARVLADLAMDDPEVLEILDSDDSFELFQDKPYFKELMRITQSEGFGKKFAGSDELQMKIDEVENIIEDYIGVIDKPLGELSEIESGIAFSITLSGQGKFTGSYNILADFEEGAIAYIDDLDYLRIDINGEVDGKETLVSFFLENTGTGRQEWSTEGHFVLEMMDEDGDLLMSLWGSEEKGYFDIESVDGPGGFVTGKIHGNCEDGESESEHPIPITANFKVKYVTNDY